MGCSVSKPETILSKFPDDPSSSSSHSVSSFLSSPLPRAVSLLAPLVHHPPLRKGDTDHFVSLTSSTYGSLLLIDSKNPVLNSQEYSDHSPPSPQSMSPDSVINTWELMDGLDDFAIDSSDSTKLKTSSIHDSQFKFQNKPSSYHYMGSDKPVKNSQSKPLWKHLSEESMLAKMDPNVVSSYIRALSSRQLGFNRSEKPKRKVSSPSNSSQPKTQFHLSNADDKIVLFFTSLRGIRKTYEDCCTVRMIFKGFRVPVDERDTSMDSEYRKQLQNAIQESVKLPQVFIRGKYIGGAEEIKNLNEIGELAKLLDGFPIRDAAFVCDNCGDARFVPCPNCNGSRKVFEEENGNLRRCHDCNENGLMRCSVCCS